MRYLFLVILWVVWCTLHSLLINLTVTEWLRKRFPYGFRFYRIAFNMIAVITLVPVLLYATTIKVSPIIAWEGWWRSVPILLGVIAMFFFISGARRYDFLQLIGLRQIKDEKTCSVLTDDCTLDTSGVLSIVRHPWYFGGMIIVWARPLDLTAILTNLIINGYFVVGAILEERKLKMQFGKQYLDYQKRVSMLLPVKWVKSKLKKKETAV